MSGPRRSIQLAYQIPDSTGRAAQTRAWDVAAFHTADEAVAAVREDTAETRAAEVAPDEYAEILRKSAAAPSGALESLPHVERPLMPVRLLFRGQSEAGWSIFPTVLRGLDWSLPWLRDGLEHNLALVNRRLAWTERFIDDLLAESAAGRLGRDLSDFSREELQLTARHYGLPSWFVDFTHSEDVAAYFATEAATDHKWGLLHAFDLEWLHHLLGVSATTEYTESTLGIFFPPGNGVVPLAPDVHVQLSEARPLMVRLRRPPLRRIRHQDAFFVSMGTPENQTTIDLPTLMDGYWTWYALELACTKYAFLQTTPREAPPAVTTARIYPPDDPIRHFAEMWKREHPLG